jgi:hypothetical protein
MRLSNLVRAEGFQEFRNVQELRPKRRLERFELGIDVGVQCLDPPSH